MKPQRVLIVLASNALRGSRELEVAVDEIQAAGFQVGVTVVEEALQHLKSGANAEETSFMVIGAKVPQALRFARKLRTVWPSGHLMFTPDVAEWPQLKRELSRAPMIGNNWSLVEPGRAVLADHITSAAHTHRRRTQLRTTLDRANSQIGTTKPTGSRDYQRLVISDRYLQNLLAQAHDAIVSLDAGFEVLYWSAGAERLFGLSARETAGRSVAELPFWTETLAKLLGQASSSDEALTTELNVSTPRGPAQLEMVISDVRDEVGTVIGMSLVMRDVTARNTALEAERTARRKIEALAYEKEQQRRLYDSMLSSAADQSYILDLDGRISYANRTVSEQFEMSLDRLIGKTVSELGFSNEDSARMERDIQAVIATRHPVRKEVSFRAPSGREWIFEYILVPVIDEQGEIEAIAGTTRDFTKRKEADERVWREANYDALTGLPNRRLFRDRLEHEVKHSRRVGAPMALFFIDLDRFKQVNDLHGHSAGDELLSQAAKRIRSCIQESDTVARLGGDEFTVILAELDDKAHVESTAQRILDELAIPFSINDAMAYVTGSIGITLYPTDAVGPEELMRNADQAMYIAKNSGRSQFSFFTRSLQDAALYRLRLLRDMRNACSLGQLRLYFQPIVNLVNGEVMKAEALLRWDHPAEGLLLPTEFISLAEESGQISKLGNWVFTEAAFWSKQWSERLGRTFQVSINKSPIQFEVHAEHMNWAEHLEAIGAARQSISVEITEGVLLNASGRVAEKLLALQEAGIELAIDDFGTGYSSMAYLKKFDVDYLKIDQSFVQDMEANVTSRTIAESIIVMAHKLGLKVIAEGVETEGQRDWLRSIGCDYAQGFLFLEPVPVDEFERYLANNADGAGTTLTDEPWDPGSS